jgi:hypothetical protein
MRRLVVVLWALASVWGLAWGVYLAFFPSITHSPKFALTLGHGAADESVCRQTKRHRRLNNSARMVYKRENTSIAFDFQ